jgi:acyl carrier protein
MFCNSRQGWHRCRLVDSSGSATFRSDPFVRTMTDSNVLGDADDFSARVRQLVVALADRGLEASTVSDEATLDALGVHSLRQIELIVRLEAEFGIVIPDERIVRENFRTIAAIQQTLRSLTP